MFCSSDGNKDACQLRVDGFSQIHRVMLEEEKDQQESMSLNGVLFLPNVSFFFRIFKSLKCKILFELNENNSFDVKQIFIL